MNEEIASDRFFFGEIETCTVAGVETFQNFHDPRRAALNTNQWLNGHRGVQTFSGKTSKRLPNAFYISIPEDI